MNPYSRWRDRVSDLALDTAHLAPFDTETTGFGPFGPGKHRLVSIAVLHATLAERNAVLVMHQFCHPQREIPAEATAVHGINTAQIDDLYADGQAHLFADIRDEVEAAFRGRIPVAHHLPFDAQVIRGELCRPEPGPDWVPPGLCTRVLSWAAWPHAPSHGLAALHDRLGHGPLVHHHEAEHDATACLRVLHSVVAELRRQGHPLHTVGELLAAQDQGTANKRAARRQAGER